MRQTATPAVPTAGTVTPQGCDAAQEASVRSAVASARTWMDDIEPKVTAFVAGTATPAVTSVVSGAITTNFHTSAAADISTIAAGFSALRTRLNGAVNFECASSFWCGDNDLAYVRGKAAFIRRMFDVNLCPAWFTCGNVLKRVGTIIHEIAHQSPGATDTAYEWEATYATQSAADAMDNADSYAVAARQIYHGGAHGPVESC
jgi:Lysine-specific metallo-endopeptidase